MNFLWTLSWVRLLLTRPVWMHEHMATLNLSQEWLAEPYNSTHQSSISTSVDLATDMNVLVTSISVIWVRILFYSLGLVHNSRLEAVCDILQAALWIGKYLNSFMIILY